MTSESRRQVWHFDGTRAALIGVSYKVTVGKDQLLRDALSAAFPNEDFVLHSMKLPPGAFYPRMARPSDQHPNQSPGSLPEYSNNVRETLIDTLN